jgi:arginyl-tRNA synthetase
VAVTPEQLSVALGQCLTDIRLAGDLAIEVPQHIEVWRSRRLAAGGWTTNIALQQSKSGMIPARELADLLASRLDKFPGVRSAQVSGPGFIDIAVDFSAAAAIIKTILQAGPKFGFSSSQAGQEVQLKCYLDNAESALKIESARWVLLGDFLRRIFQALGAEVSYEYATTENEFRSSACPHKILTLAVFSRVAADWPAGRVSTGSACKEDTVGAKSRTHTRGTLPVYARVLAELGVIMDFSAMAPASPSGRSPNQIAEQRIILCCYHPAAGAAEIKFGKANNPSVVDVRLARGSSHFPSVELDEGRKDIEDSSGQGPGAATLGYIRDSRFSVRSNNGCEPHGLLDWMGLDPLRFAVARCPADSELDIKSGLFRQRNFANPVFIVQYAFARTRNVARWAAADGISAAAAFAPELLSSESESELLATLSEFPTVVTQSVARLEPHRIARYLEGLAGAYHQWYDQCPVRPQSRDDPITELHHTRLWLNDATGVVLANGLDVLGVTAPERM